jgi:bifunctional DNA-binding transcriptional regulator/antitoxin component of YhaV-PrlF toxin-antitoxin module
VPIVRVKEKYQVTIPNALRDHLSVGDFLEARRERNGVITLIPKSFIDRRIAEGLADIRAGRVHGPYDMVDEAVVAMKEQIKTGGAVKKRQRNSR